MEPLHAIWRQLKSKLNGLRALSGKLGVVKFGARTDGLEVFRVDNWVEMYGNLSLREGFKWSAMGLRVGEILPRSDKIKW